MSRSQTSTIEVGGARLVRPKAAAWDDPWTCAHCGAASPKPDFTHANDFIAWAARHQAGACR